MAVIVGQNSPVQDDITGTPLIGYHNVVVVGGITSLTADADFPIANVANPATHQYWKGGVNTGSEVIDITTNYSGAIDYIAIAGHNLGSEAIPITISDVGVSPANILLASTTLVDDLPTILRFASGVYSTLRITLDASSAPDGAVPQIAVIYCGKLLVLERGIKVDVTHVPITFGRRTRMVNGMSESGNFLGRIVLSESRASKAEFFGFTPTFYRSYIDDFLQAAEEIPFFWAWAPYDYPLEVGYVWLTNDAEPEVSPDHRRIALTLNMAGIA